MTYSLEVENFGPIRRAHVDLRPLTVFVGANNTGKSYCAILVYALKKTFSESVFDLAFWVSHARESPKRDSQYNKSSELDLIDSYRQDLAVLLTEEIKRCFGADFANLARTRRSRVVLAVKCENSQVDLTFRGNSEALVNETFRVSDESASTAETSRAGWPFRSPLPGFGDRPFYFPAARSGMLQVHKAFASSLVKRLPFAGIEPLDVPTISGVAADFVAHLLQLETSGHIARSRSLKPGVANEFAEQLVSILSKATVTLRRSHLTEGVEKATQVADFLESELLRGQIRVRNPEGRLTYPEILYESGKVEIPIHRSSSMVSEVAPIAIFLRRVISAGDLVIIEEPEAHLHPDNQLLMARAVVRLVNLGVRVLLTTHSDFFLQQLSNCVRASKVPKTAQALGLEKEDRLAPEQISVRLFRKNRQYGFSETAPVEVTGEGGIEDEQFQGISEALCQESAKLQWAVVDGWE